MNARATWKRCYSEARRTNAAGRDLFAIICDAMGKPHNNSWMAHDEWLPALALQQCLSKRHDDPRSLYQSLAETVLNRFGTKNLWGNRIEYGSRAWHLRDRADQLSRRMIAAGRVRQDAGGWIRGVVA